MAVSLGCGSCSNSCAAINAGPGAVFCRLDDKISVEPCGFFDYEPGTDENLGINNLGLLIPSEKTVSTVDLTDGIDEDLIL